MSREHQYTEDYVQGLSEPAHSSEARDFFPLSTRLCLTYLMPSNFLAISLILQPCLFFFFSSYCIVPLFLLPVSWLSMSLWQEGCLLSHHLSFNLWLSLQILAQVSLPQGSIAPFELSLIPCSMFLSFIVLIIICSFIPVWLLSRYLPPSVVPRRPRNVSEFFRVAMAVHVRYWQISVVGMN